MNLFVETLVKHPGFVSVLQSTKDRRFSKLEGQMDGLQKSLYEKLQAEGMNIDKAAEIAVAQNFAPQVPAQSMAPALPATDTIKTVLEDTGLSNDDPDVIATMQRNLSPEAMTAALYQTAYRRTKPPSPAAVVTPSGSGGDNQNLMANKYRQEMIAARGKGVDVGRAIREKYQGQGVDIDAISF
jgi:hypothetical protein